MAYNGARTVYQFFPEVTLTSMLKLTLYCAESSDGQKNGRKLTTTIKTIKGQKTGYTTQNIVAFRYRKQDTLFAFSLKVQISESTYTFSLGAF